MNRATGMPNFAATTDLGATSEMQANLAANLRLLCGYYPSIAHVCRTLGINRTQFNRYLGAKALPSANLLNRLCDHFGVEDTEIYLPPSHFSRLVSIRRKPSETRAVYADTVEQMQGRSRPEMRKYLGYYFEYYYSMSSPGKIIRGVVHFFESGGATYFHRIEHFPRTSMSGSAFKCRYVGAAFFLEDRIFMVDTETLTGNEISQTILFPIWRNRVSRLSGLVMGVSSGDHRKIACSRILLEWLGTDIDLRKALSACSLFDPESPEIDPAIREAIDNASPPEAPLFYARAV
jgi:transcriptional regulator with XRE-family HTH domain